jgi:hypothetical protein
MPSPVSPLKYLKTTRFDETGIQNAVMLDSALKEQHEVLPVLILCK